MDYNKLLEKREIFNRGKANINLVTLSSYEKNFELEFTHNSTAIEGNTLTLMETYAVKGDLDPFTNLIAQLEEEQLDDYIRLVK